MRKEPAEGQSASRPARQHLLRALDYLRECAAREPDQDPDQAPDRKPDQAPDRKPDQDPDRERAGDASGTK